MPVAAKDKSEPVVSKFAGFPKAGLQFLRDLHEHNDRDWFRERKAIYEETVRLPMELLVHEVAAGCRKRDFALYAKEKNPVMRVYRDIRFSPDKRPFNTHVGAGLKASQNKTGIGEVYLHISPEGSFFAAGFWMPERPFVQVWREAMANNPKAFERIMAALAKNKLKVSSEKPLTRMPRGFEAQAEGPLAEQFKLNSYTVSQQLKISECTSPKLVETAIDFIFAAKPLLEYGWALNYAPKRDILEGRDSH